MMVRRKNDHIAICINEDVESRSETFDAVLLKPAAVPEFALDDVDTSVSFLGKTFSLPILITGMTGGVEQGRRINRDLAQGAAAFGIPMGLGSQKMMLSEPSFKPLFDVKRDVPDVFLIGNLGLSCFNYGVTLDDVARLIEELGLDAMAFHLNALQEAIQPEGETNFLGLLEHLERACRVLPCPVMVKEVGSGMCPQTVSKLASTGVAAIDVGGVSGTSWGYIEGRRGGRLENRLGETFRNWGHSTLRSLTAAHRCLHGSLPSASGVGSTFGPPSLPGGMQPAISQQTYGGLRSPPLLVATGGIRNGLHVAKAVACGATMSGVGLPLLRAVLESDGSDGTKGVNRLSEELEFFARGLRIAQFASGARTLGDLAARSCLPRHLLEWQ